MKLTWFRKQLVERGLQRADFGYSAIGFGPGFGLGFGLGFGPGLGLGFGPGFGHAAFSNRPNGGGDGLGRSPVNYEGFLGATFPA